MFGIILLTAVTIMHIYVFWRAGSLPFVKRHVPRKLFILTGIGLWGVFGLGRILGHDNSGAFAGMLEIIGMTWMGMLFLFSVSLFIVDIVTGFGYFMPKLKTYLRGAAMLTGGVLSMIALVQGMRAPVVSEYDVHLSGLSSEMDGIVLVAVSDLHLGSQLGRQWLERLVILIQAQNPDLIVLLGDLFEGHGIPGKDLLAGFKGLSAPLGVWAVLGNHEFHGREDSNTGLLNGFDVTVLRNSWAEVRPGLVLAGLDDLTANRKKNQDIDFIPKVLEGRPQGATILLSHTPWKADSIARSGADLMLSGHTHGGQIWPFGCLVKLKYPLLAGRYEVDGMTVIVSRGAGTWGLRMRLFQPGEILRVTLHSKADVS